MTMTVSPERRFELIHETYASLSGRPVPWTRNTLHRWTWLAVEAGNLSEPLETALVRVITRIHRLARDFPAYRHHLDFRKITDPAVFVDHWSAAIAEARKPAPMAPGLKDVLKATGRPTEKATSPAITAAQALERTKLSEQLAKWKSENL